MFGQRLLVCVAAIVAVVSSSSAGVSAQRLRSRALAEEAAMADAASFYSAMLQRVNEERVKSGVGKLCYNKKLQQAAQLHSEDQARNGQMTHTGSDGSDLGTRITRAGYKWNAIAENVAAGQVDVKAVMDSWMDSDGHRKNLLNKDYTHFGMGYAYNAQVQYKHYWTQDFATGSGEGCDGEAQNEADVIEPTPAPAPAPAPQPAPAPAPIAAPTAAPTPAPTAAPTTAPKPETPKQVNPATSSPTAGKKKRDCHAQ